MKSRYKFTIPGVPYRAFKADHTYAMTMPGYSENRIRYLVTLESQFGDEPMIREPIDINVKFYMPLRQKLTAAKLIHLFKFINNIALGMIYQKESLIHNLTLNKYYVKEPRIEMTIKPHAFKDKDG